MLDLRRLQSDPEGLATALRRRDPSSSIEPLLALDAERKRVIAEHDRLRHRQRELSEVFRGEAPAEQKAEARASLKEISGRVKELHERQQEIAERLHDGLMELPNPPAPEVPSGKDESENVVVRGVGEPPDHRFDVRDHVEIGTALGILDFDRASRLSGARFASYRGAGARLERALMNLMLDLHTSRGYTEVLTPFLVSREAMTGTGQLPKFEEDAFVTTDDLFLIPTAEVPVTNLHREEILDSADLPIRYCAFSPCFRREAGSYGKVTRGLIRLHQFQKVEMVRFCRPEDSEVAHEELVADAEHVLQTLGLPYRVVELCAGDLGFAARRCFDLEVWSPGQKRYVEISSCSNFGSFQARRASIRYRPAPGARPRHVHTLNGSGLAIGRTVVALLENFQTAEGTVDLPEALWPYMGGLRRLG